ncbi:hypothetical protein MHY20_11405 [Helcobacillus sp. ACRRO]|uniref:hypothetical protein n=1 Tax=Helcobacillus sp. ACRRO TaxID=2918202 RepID=UPI001EF4ECE4|nr:hypothetical protein [Helcobacillus sp. ACRRO]MCG7428200.1 hypothetical protein [Helcobacillus sp. ACRRO]
MCLHQRVAAPLDAVGSIITDIPNAARTLSGVDAVEILTEGPYRPGTRWRETRQMLGMAATAEMVVHSAAAPGEAPEGGPAQGADGDRASSGSDAGRADGPGRSGTASR